MGSRGAELLVEFLVQRVGGGLEARCAGRLPVISRDLPRAPASSRDLPRSPAISRDLPQGGLLVDEGGAGEYECNDIEGNAKSGVTLRGACEPVLRRNKV